MQPDSSTKVVSRCTIPGRPTPLNRPRFGKGHVYDSQKDIKIAYTAFLRHTWRHTPPLERPLILEVDFFFKPPRKKDNGLPHSGRPDLSNLVKFIEDVAIGVLYKDDAQICEIRARKFYGLPERTALGLIAVP